MTDMTEQSVAAGRFSRLPEPVRLEDTVEIKDESPVPDPEAGHNTDIEFTLRYAG